MNSQQNTSHDSKTITINIEGVFDLSKQAWFRQSYETVKSAGAKYVLNMRNTDYMDSAAFGMLLVLRDYAGGDKADISIINTSEAIRKSFVLLNFDRLFKIN